MTLRHPRVLTDLTERSGGIITGLEIQSNISSEFDLRIKDKQRYRDMLTGTVSRRVLMETFEPRVLLSADLLPIAGEITQPGEQDTYSIAIAEPTRVFFDSMTDVDLTWRLQGPDGTDLKSAFNRNDGYYAGYSSERSLPLAQDLVRGTYTLTVEGVGSTTGDYELRLRDLDAEVQVVTSGETVNGTLPSGKETAVYAIDGKAGEVLRVDITAISSTSNRAGLWTVMDAQGTRLRIEYGIEDMQFALPTDGRYYMFAEGRIGQSEEFNFTFDVSLGTHSDQEYAIGDTVSASIANAGESDTYHFTVASDGRFAFYGTASERFSQHWEIRGRDGTIKAVNDWPPSASSPDILDLEAGDYWIVFKGRSADTPSYSFTLEDTGEPYAGTPATRPVEAISLGQTVTGNIPNAGDWERYDFELTERMPIRLDFPVYSSHYRVWLQGPSGEVFYEANNNADGDWDPARNVATVEAGKYSVIVQAKYDTTETFGFRVTDYSAAEHTDLTAPITATLAADQTFKAWTFDLMAGDELVLDATVRDATGSWVDPNWRLIDPRGKILMRTDVGPDDTPSLAIATIDGTYRLELQRDSNDILNSFSANVYLRPKEETPASLDVAYEVALDEPGAVHDLVYKITEPTYALLDLSRNLSNGANLTFRITNATGDVVANSNSYYDALRHSSVFFLAKGEYRLRVSGDKDETGSARLGLKSFDSAQTVTVGNQVDATIDDPAALRIFKVSAVAGQRFYIDNLGMTGVSRTSEWAVYDPIGNMIVRTGITSGDTSFDADRDGDYFIVIQPDMWETDLTGYSFVLRDASVEYFPLAVGDTVGNSLDLPYGRHEYVLELTENRRLYLDTLASSRVYWALYNDLNEQTGYGWIDDNVTTNNIIDVPPGSYRMVLNAYLAETPTYSFRLVDMAANSTPLSFDQPVSVTSATGEAYFFTFEANGTDRFFLDRPSGDLYQYQVIGPDGYAAWSAPSWSSRDADFDLPKPGVYTLVVNPSYGVMTGIFNFALNRRTESQDSLTIGSTVEGTIAKAGDSVRYAFTVPENGTYVIDTHNNTSGINWRIERDGITLFGPANFNATNFANVYDLAGGDYEFVVDGAADFKGDFAFSIHAFTSATPLVKDVSTDVFSLARPGELDPCSRLECRGWANVIDFQTF